MKTTLTISILLNLGMLGGLVLICTSRRWDGGPSAPPSGTQTGPPAQTAAASAPPIVLQPKPKPFRWSRLESGDYRTYVKNLRGIGCPEPALRAIVTADVELQYQKRIRELVQKLADFNNSSWSAKLGALNSRQVWKAELENIPGEETAQIADLLGFQPSPAGTVVDVMASDGRPEEDTPCSLPLVLQTIDPTALNLSSDQIEVINDIRQRFLDGIGGPNQDPNDPAYLARWQKAQPEADDMLRGMLGISVFENVQLTAQIP